MVLSESSTKLTIEFNADSDAPVDDNSLPAPAKLLTPSIALAMTSCAVVIC